MLATNIYGKTHLIFINNYSGKIIFYQINYEKNQRLAN
jgi:hypothetical protein